LTDAIVRREIADAGPKWPDVAKGPMSSKQ
jgi:hypothetical protein